MTQLFLLKLIADLLFDNPTQEKIDVAKKIVDGMIKEMESVPHQVQELQINANSTLDPEAQAAMRELQ